MSFGEDFFFLSCVDMRLLKDTEQGVVVYDSVNLFF